MRRLRAISRIWTILLGVVVLLLLSGLAVRFVLPHAPWVARPTVSITPAGGATEVVPRSRIVLQFSRPMNRHSVEQALQIDPPTAGTLTWSDDGQTLRFLPDPALTSGITYTVSLGAGARSRWWRPLAEPVRVAFRTVRSPTVIAALPNAANIPTDTPVALVFSRPMVPPARLNTPVELPQLRIEPPLPGTARWIDVDTLLLRPAAPLQPDTRYQATIAGLSDVRGVELEEPVTWRWHTRAPTLLSYAPAAEDRWVAPRQPLQLTLAQPLDPATLRERLVLTPTMPVDLATATLPTGNQVITFTPTVDWQPDRTYSALFRLRQPDPPEESPVAAGGLDTATVTWSFTTAPEPEQTGSFPGQGQLLPRGQSVRLIFSTPMDATALSAGLTLDPPVDDLRVNVDDTMVRLLADWQPATSYTLSIPADVVDRNGVPLQNEYRLDFRTAPAAADLSLPEVNAHILSVPATDQPVALTVERTNLAALELELYSLDAATLLRTLTFSPADWRAFRPERYNQSLLRAWRVPLDDPPDQTIRSPLSLAATEAAAPLPPGAYYLHLSAPEGPQENLVLLVSNIELLFKQSATEVLVWAVDRGAGTPLADLPLTLYRGDAVVARGQSNSSGLWQVTHNRRADDPPYLVLAGDPALAVVSSAWQLPTALPGAALTDAARYRSVLTTSRQAYTAGETVQVGGFVRQVLPDGTLALPRTGTPLELLVQPVNSSTIVTRTTVALPVSGVVSAGLQLDQLLAPGEYTVRATVDDAVVRLPFWVRADAVSFDITFDAAGAVLPLRVTSAAVPVASAELTWNLRAVPVDPRPPPALPSGFHFGDPEQSLAPAIMQAGHGQTDAAGQFAIPLVDPATLTRTLRYAVSVEVAGPGGARSQAATLVTLEPTGTRVGLRLPNRIVTPGEPAVVEALALDASGTPVADARITVELYQRTWTESPASTGFLEPQDQLLLTRSVNADDQGRLQLELPVTANGEYRVVARADALSSAAPFWATTPGYTGWAATDTQVEVIPNRESYRPGDTARLLVTSPFEIAATLVTLEQNGTVSPQVQPLRAGELLDIPITPEMAPNTYVGLVLVEQGTGGTPAGVRYGYARLNVVAELPTVTTTITTNQETYMPGETATVTLTTRNADGEGVSANLLLAVTGDDRHGNDLPPPDLALPQQVYPPLPAGMLTAAGIVVREGYSGYGPVIPRNPEPDAALRFDPQLARVAYWNPRLRTAYDGALVVRVPLPRETANWRITAYTARGANFFGQASTVVAAVAPLELAPETPPLLRAGDRTEVAVVVRNTTSLTRELRVTLNAGGAMLEDSASAAQIGALPPGGAARFAWSLRANTATSAPAQARLRFSAATADGVRAGTSLILPIAPAGATRTTAETLEVTGAVSQYIPAATRETPNATEAMLPIACRESAGYCPWAALELVIAPTTRAAIVTSARDLLDLPERSLEQEASLLLLSATLVRTAEDAAAAAPWHAQIRRSRTILAAAQTEASGWGAWPDAAPTPFLTGYVLEAQAVAAAALDEPFQPDPDALRWLRQADTPASDPDLRAYIQYVLAQVGAGDPEAARALLDLDLGADGLAYLALTLPSDEAESPLARLRTLVRRTSAVNPAGSVQLFWEAENAALPARSSVSTTAVAVLALQRLQPDSPQIPPALRTLRLAWGVDGWPTAFAGARAGLALLAAEADLDAAPSDEGDARAYELVLNADTLVSSNQSRSAIHSLLLTGEQLRARNLLRIVPQDADSAAAAPLLVAYRLREQIPAPITRTQELAIHQDLLDPDSATPLDPEALQVGQLVRVRLTLLALQPLDGVTLDAPLPAPFAPVVSDWRVGSGVGNAASDQPWSLAVSDWSDARLQFVGTDLAPGIYTQDYLARVVAPGSFTVPPPRAAPTANPDDAALGRERHLRVNQ